MTRPLPRVISITGPDGGPVDVRRCLVAVLLRCDKCTEIRHPKSAKAGESCTYGSGVPSELAEDNGAMCGGELREVVAA